MPATSPSLLMCLRNDSSNSGSWSRFVEIYTPLLIHWIKRMGLEYNEAVDIVQEVMLEMLVRLPTFRYDANSSFRGWLRTITTNKTRDYLRRNHARRKYESHKALELPQENSMIFEDAEFNQALARRALELMNCEFEESTWRACWESVVCGRRAESVAKELGITVNAVYLAKGRVLRRLRQELEGML